MIHRQTVEGYQGSLAQLAEDIGNLRYDGLAELLRLLAEKIERDSAKDEARGRPKLAAALRAAAGLTPPPPPASKPLGASQSRT